jgi:hypothetical protein
MSEILPFHVGNLALMVGIPIKKKYKKYKEIFLRKSGRFAADFFKK